MGEILAELGRQRQTKAWLAETAGIPMSTLHRRLLPDAGSPLTLDEVEQIATALHVHTSDLLGPLVRLAAAS